MKQPSILSTLSVSLYIALVIASPLVAQENKSTTGAAGPAYFPFATTGGTPLPFSEAVKLGDTIYVSGQIGFVPGTLTLTPGGLGPEARRALENIKGILERHGTSMNNVVKCTVFLAEIKDWPAFNEIYREYFKTNPPARSALGVTGLAFGARVEVECIAFVPPKR